MNSIKAFSAHKVGRCETRVISLDLASMEKLLKSGGRPGARRLALQMLPRPPRPSPKSLKQKLWRVGRGFQRSDSYTARFIVVPYGAPMIKEKRGDFHTSHSGERKRTRGMGKGESNKNQLQGEVMCDMGSIIACVEKQEDGELTAKGAVGESLFLS